MKDNNDENEPFSQDINVPLKSQENQNNKNEKIKIFLILSVPVIFIIGLIIILLIITHSKKNKVPPEKGNKITAKYNIKVIDYKVNLINYLNENINDTIEVMIMDNETINNTFTYFFDSEGNHTLEIYFKKNMTSLEKMFQNCRDLIEIDLSKLYFGEVISTSYMFDSCTNLINVSMNNLNTTNLAYMDSMFISCYKLTSLNLNSFSNTHNIVDISYTFANCK